MSDSTNVSLKFGGGYEAPWFTVYGTPAEIKAQLIEATGLDAEHYGQRDLVEVIVEASRWARGIYTAAEKLADPPKVTVKEVSEKEPTPESAPSTSPMAKKTAAPKGGLAAQAKAAKGAEPEVVDPPLDQLIKTAPSEQFMYELHESREAEWTDEATALVKARLAELKAA